MNFIEELFYGNIHPHERSFSRNSQYGKAMEVISKSEHILTEELDGKLKSHFLDFVNAQSEINSITAYESFLDGFILGAGFMRDTFLTEHNRVFKDI